MGLDDTESIQLPSTRTLNDVCSSVHPSRTTLAFVNRVLDMFHLPRVSFRLRFEKRRLGLGSEPAFPRWTAGLFGHTTAGALRPVAHWCFDDPHVQEPNIHLPSTWRAANRPRSFWIPGS